MIACVSPAKALRLRPFRLGYGLPCFWPCLILLPAGDKRAPFFCRALPLTYTGQSRWFLMRAGQVSGPHSLTELNRLVAIGEASDEDRVQAEGAGGWTLLSHVCRQSGPSPSAAPALTQKLKPKFFGIRYISMHWRGDLSLGISYWVCFVLLSVIAEVAIKFIMELRFIAASGPLGVAIAVTSLTIMLVMVSLWQVVGTWRSSDKHVSRGSRKIWAIAAKMMLCISVLRNAIIFPNTVLTVAQSWWYASLMSTLPPMTITALRGGAEIEITGGIGSGSADVLRQVLANAPQARVVHLSGPGGGVAEAHAMAATIRSRGMDTYVGASCLSACTLLFISGRNRLLKSGAQLGFHQPAFVAAGTGGLLAVDQERQLLVAAGVPEWFVTKAFSVRGNDIWFPTEAELLSAQVVTAITDGQHLSPGRSE